jgi:hypothetical protein
MHISDSLCRRRWGNLLYVDSENHLGHTHPQYARQMFIDVLEVDASNSLWTLHQCNGIQGQS